MTTQYKLPIGYERIAEYRGYTIAYSASRGFAGFNLDNGYLTRAYIGSGYVIDAIEAGETMKGPD